MSTHGSYSQTFQSVAGRYAKLMGRKDDVKVTFGGEVAYTDGRVVNLPALPAGTTMSSREATVFGGYLDHETAHIRFKSFDGLDINRKDNPVLFSLWNIIEDIRVENEQMKIYPGSRAFLDELCDEIDSRGKDRETEDSKAKETFGQKIFSMIYKEAWTKYRQVCSPREKDNLDNYQELAPIADIMRKEMPRMASVKDSREIAKKIFDLLPKDADYGAHPAPSAGQKVKLCINMSAVLGQASKKQKSGSSRPGNGMPMPGATPQEVELCDESGKPLSESDKALLGAALEALENGDRTKAMTSTLLEIQQKNDKEGGTKGAVAKPEKSSTGKAVKTTGYVRYGTAGTRILPPVTTMNDRIFVPSEENKTRYNGDRADLSAEIMATKKMLKIFLMSREKRAYSRGLEEGTFDEEEVPSMLMGNRHIYMEKRDCRVLNTDVGLMIDLSTSMNSSMIRQSGILIAESLDGLRKINLGIFGFASNQIYAPVLPQDGGRNEGIDIYVFKEFDTPYRKCTGRLGGIDVRGCTPLGDGYAYAFEAMVQRKTKRRVLWLVSDGEPCISIKNPDHNEFLLMKHIHHKCRAYGIETVGLGIGRGLQLGNFVDKYVEIRSCSEFPRAVLEMMKGIGVPL